MTVTICCASCGVVDDVFVSPVDDVFVSPVDDVFVFPVNVDIGLERKFERGGFDLGFKFGMLLNVF